MPIPLPMAVTYRRVPDEGFGTNEVYAEALQPMGFAVTFDLSHDLVNWEQIGYWSEYVEDQQVGVGVICRQECAIIRATLSTSEAIVPAGSFTPISHTESKWHPTVKDGFQGKIFIDDPYTMSMLKAKLSKFPTPPFPGGQ